MFRLACLLTLIALPLAAEIAHAQPATRRARPAAPRPAATGEQLDNWADQLDADEFLARETAMINLVAAGERAIAAVKPKLTQGSLEANTRALHVLQQLGLSPDEATQEAAREALNEATASKDNPVLARRAEGVLAQLFELRSARALADLEALGAQVARSQSFNGVTTEDIVESVEIGPAFRGELADLSRLKWLTAIRLVLVGPRVNDEWLKAAAAMTEVEELHLYQATVTDEGLAAVARHPGLRHIGIYYTPLSGQALAHLEKLPLLAFVKLYGTKVERAEAEKFQTAAGLAKIDHRKGAFLGVGCTPIDNECVLTTVHGGSPAEKAGLLRDDVLVRFGTAKVDSFETLTALISQLDAGEEVEIEVRRHVDDDAENIRTNNFVLKATLAPWDVELAVENGLRP
jgi:hypothetical protein